MPWLPSVDGGMKLHSLTSAAQLCTVQ